MGQTGLVTGLRERNKAMRVEAILDATVELLDSRRFEDVTTEEIAGLAGVAPATVYNLVGPRDQLVRALVQRVVDDLVEAVAEATATADDPIVVAHLIVDHSVAAFTSHSEAYRQVVAVGRSRDAQPSRETRPGGILDPSQLQATALRAAQEQGILRSELDAGGLGRQVYISWIGAMEHWADGVLDDTGFAIAARHGLLVVLAAAATDAFRDRFVEELAAVARRLERSWRR